MKNKKNMRDDTQKRSDSFGKGKFNMERIEKIWNP